MFLNGTADPVDPPAKVADAHATMPNSLVVPVADPGHGQLDFDPTGCLGDDVNTFLAQGVLSTLDSWEGCSVQSMPLPAFTV